MINREYYRILFHNQKNPDSTLYAYITNKTGFTVSHGKSRLLNLPVILYMTASDRYLSDFYTCRRNISHSRRR